MRAFAFLVLALAVLSCSAQIQAPAVSQSGGAPTTRSIEGTVRNSLGAALPNAIVLLTDTKTLQVRSFIAQKDGQYHFYGLSMDVNYQVRGELNDMTSQVKTVSVFDSHRKVSLNLKLKKAKIKKN